MTGVLPQVPWCATCYQWEVASTLHSRFILLSAADEPALCQASARLCAIRYPHAAEGCRGVTYRTESAAEFVLQLPSERRNGGVVRVEDSMGTVIRFPTELRRSRNAETLGADEARGRVILLPVVRIERWSDDRPDEAVRRGAASDKRSR
jgi:hypothetical protein